GQNVTRAPTIMLPRAGRAKRIHHVASSICGFAPSRPIPILRVRESPTGDSRAAKSVQTQSAVPACRLRAGGPQGRPFCETQEEARFARRGAKLCKQVLAQQEPPTQEIVGLDGEARGAGVMGAAADEDGDRSEAPGLRALERLPGEDGAGQALELALLA